VPWRHAVYKAAKGKLPVWEYSWQRFQQGKEKLMDIAQNQGGGKAGILPRTVMGEKFKLVNYQNFCTLKLSS